MLRRSLHPLDEGLRKDGTSLSQIPTYVTGVPNGTEKVFRARHTEPRKAWYPVF